MKSVKTNVGAIVASLFAIFPTVHAGEAYKNMKIDRAYSKNTRGEFKKNFSFPPYRTVSGRVTRGEKNVHLAVRALLECSESWNLFVELVQAQARDKSLNESILFRVKSLQATEHFVSTLKSAVKMLRDDDIFAGVQRTKAFMDFEAGVRTNLGSIYSIFYNENDPEICGVIEFLARRLNVKF